MKIHDLHIVVIDGSPIYYFYTRGKNDTNGNPRYNVYITDPDVPAVYETVFKCYQSQLPELVTAYIKDTIATMVPF